MATNALSLFKANDPYEQLISNILTIEREPQLNLKLEKTEQERLKGVLSDADSKLSALDTILKRFVDPFSGSFSSRAATVPTGAGFTVSVGDSTAFGSHTIQVDRLAKSDTRLTKQFTRSAGTLAAFFAANGAQTFSISVAHPTTADPTNRVDVQVSVNPVGTTDEEILKEISTAISDAMQTAVDGGLITSAERANASVVNETSTTTRLSLRSGSTGYTHRLGFTDSANGLLSMLELDLNAVQSGTSGGMITDVGTNETDSLLNARAVVNGLTIYRDSNTITDAIGGATITLSKVTTAPEEFSVDTDSASIRDEINDFISKYNEILTFISGKSEIDGTANTRGDFANDSAFRGLRFDMRNDMVRNVSGQLAGAPVSLADIGITINNDGTLVLSDEEKLFNAIRNDSSGFQKLFNGADGYATRLKTRVDRFLGVDGLIDKREEVLDDRISRLDDRIADWDTRLERRENQLRAEYARLQEVIATLQNQSAAFLSYLNF